MKKTISLQLNGDITLSDFSKVMAHFTDLIDELSSDIGRPAEIEWEIAKLEGGSATAVIVGKSPDLAAVEKVVQAYETIGKAIESNGPIPYSQRISRQARAITEVLNGKITSIEMRTEEFEAVIHQSVYYEEEFKTDYSFGTVTGKVETLSKHGRMRFVLYDTLFNRAVNCYLSKDQEYLMLDAWDKRIMVSGKIFRDPTSDRPLEIRDINYIEVKDEVQPGTFLQVEGIIPWKEGDEYPEEIIRRYRDAQ